MSVFMYLQHFYIADTKPYYTKFIFISVHHREYKLCVMVNRRDL